MCITFWMKAMAEEIKAIRDNGTYELVPLPVGHQPINQGALHIASGNVGIFHGRMKHYTIKVNHLRDTATKKLIKLAYCSTDDMVTDLLTKALSHVKLHYLKGRLNMKALTSN